MSKLWKTIDEMSSKAQAMIGLVAFASLIVAGTGVVTFAQVKKVETRVAMVEQRVDKKILRDDETYFQGKLRAIRADYMEEGRWLPGTKQSTKDDYDYFNHQLLRTQDELRKYDPEPGGSP